MITPWHLLVLRLIGGIFPGGTMPAVNALIADWAEKGREGEIYGLSSSVGAGGMALGPMVGASVSVIWGYRGVFIATSLILLITAVVFGGSKGFRPAGSTKKDSIGGYNP